jgi:hypothetical protein
MLGVKTYPKPYVKQCRAQIDAQLDAYKAVATAAAKSKRAAIDAFEPLFFNNLTVVLDRCFVHRLRGVEGKDGNPLNEVRMLCDSVIENKGVLRADKTIKYEPETSVSKLAVGDSIALDQATFTALCDAFFAEIQRKFT